MSTVKIGGEYRFEGGFPTPETVQRAYDDADLVRAITAYRFFYPTVSGVAIFNGNVADECVPNEVFGMIDTEPLQVGYTLNSDTPYGPMLLDLRGGPIVIELPPGPLICIAIDLNQRWILDMGLPGPDAGKGGRHLIVPPGYDGEIPEGYNVGRSTTYRVIGAIRVLPLGGDLAAANARFATISVHPLNPSGAGKEGTWADLTGKPQDTTPLSYETSLDYWRQLHEVVDTEPPLDAYAPLYGELAALGIVKGKAFAPDERMTRILEDAARIGNGQMRVQSFADRRADRVVWPAKQWEWAALRFENGDFYADGYLDVDAREKWFYQAIGASPAMFRRTVGAGSLYWLGLRDSSGAYFDGGKSYTLTVPQRVPCKLFWSVTVYDAETRSQIQTDQGRAAIRSMFDLADEPTNQPLDLYFGPAAPEAAGNRWIKTIPGKGWFVYFRIYGPQGSAFDGSWQLPDFKAPDSA